MSRWAIQRRGCTVPANNVYPDPDLSIKPKFKVDDIVYRQLEVPYNALGQKQSTKKFRVADYRWDVKQPRKIVAVIPFEGLVPFRYLLDGIKNASFTENQLMLAPVTEQESKYIVEKIFDKKVEGKKIFYKVKWQNYLKKDIYKIFLVVLASFLTSI